MDLTHAQWRKSTRSSDQANCVEVAFVPEAVAVRDSKAPDGQTLAFSVPSWSNFLSPA